MLRINRFSEDFDEEEIKNIFNTLTDDGFELSSWPGPESEKCNVILTKRISDNYIESDKVYLDVDNISRKLKMSEDLYGSCYEVCQRLSEDHDLLFFKINTQQVVKKNTRLNPGELVCVVINLAFKKKKN